MNTNESKSKNKQYDIPVVSNRNLWKIEPYFDGISTAVTLYKVVDPNGTLQYLGNIYECEYFLLNGC